LLGLFIVTTTTVLNTTPDVLAQTTTSSEAEKKKDIFKVIMTVQGLDHNSGDIVTIVSVNGESRVKLFDDTKTYIHSVNANGTGGLIEYVAAFPNMTVNVGDEYKVCALTIKDSNLTSALTILPSRDTMHQSPLAISSFNSYLTSGVQNVVVL
jgi:hypothetical protein